MELQIQTWKSPDWNTLIQILSNKKQFTVLYNKQLEVKFFNLNK